MDLLCGFTHKNTHLIERPFLFGILVLYVENSKKKQKWFLQLDILLRPLAKFEAPAKKNMEFQKQYFKQKWTPKNDMIEKRL